MEHVIQGEVWFDEGPNWSGAHKYVPIPGDLSVYEYVTLAIEHMQSLWGFDWNHWMFRVKAVRSIKYVSNDRTDTVLWSRSDPVITRQRIVKVEYDGTWEETEW